MVQTRTYRNGWIAVGVVLAVVLAVIAYAFLGAVVFGIFLYYATRPFHERIEPRVGQPTVSALLALLALAIPLVLLVAYATAIALQELSAFAAVVDLGPYQDLVEPYIDVSTIVDNPETLLENLGDPRALIEPLLSALEYLSVIGSGLLSLFIATTLAFYLLRDGHLLVGYIALADDEKGILRSYASAVDSSLKTIYFGNILNAFLTGVIGAITFSLLNLVAPDAYAIPYPALLGILAGAGSLIPVVGMKIIYVPMLVYLAAQAAITGVGWAFVVLTAAVTVVVVDFIPDLLLRPYVSGGDLHTGTVMFAYVLGPLLWGWYGLFLGPLVLVIGSHFVRLVLPELLAGRELRSEAVGPGRYVQVAPDDAESADSGQAESTEPTAEKPTDSDGPIDDSETPSDGADSE